MKFLRNKKGLTLAELVISISIGGIILAIIFVFIDRGTENINIARNNSSATKDVLELRKIIADMNNSGYTNYELLVDSPDGAGNDVLLLKNDDDSEGYIIAVVNSETLNLVNEDDFDIYSKKHIGYKKLSDENLTDINLDLDTIYYLNFARDKIFFDMDIRELRMEMFNSGEIVDMDINYLINYRPSLEGETWDTAKGQIFNEFNLIF